MKIFHSLYFWALLSICIFTLLGFLSYPSFELLVNGKTICKGNIFAGQSAHCHADDNKIVSMTVGNVFFKKDNHIQGKPILFADEKQPDGNVAYGSGNENVEIKNITPEAKKNSVPNKPVISESSLETPLIDNKKQEYIIGFNELLRDVDNLVFLYQHQYMKVTKYQQEHSCSDTENFINNQKMIDEMKDMYPLVKKSYKIKSMKIAIQYTYILRHKIALLELKLADMATHDCENDK